MNLWYNSNRVEKASIGGNIMYQRILNLLNIRGYQKEMTPLGPCYVKEDWGRKKEYLLPMNTNRTEAFILQRRPDR